MDTILNMCAHAYIIGTDDIFLKIFGISLLAIEYFSPSTAFFSYSIISFMF